MPNVIRAVSAVGLWRGPTIETIPLDRTQIAVRYGAFIDKERKEALRHRANEFRLIPDDLDFASVMGLRVEARHQLAAGRPPSVGHAARTAGVTPSDIGALLVHLTRQSPGFPGSGERARDAAFSQRDNNVDAALPVE